MSKGISSLPAAHRPTPPWLRNSAPQAATAAGVLTQQTVETPEWRQLHAAAAGNHAADAVLVLQGLTDNRHRLGGISTGAAEVLLGTLQASSAWHPEASAQVMRLAMPLLARFVLTTSRLALGPRHAASQQTMSTSATSPPAITPAGVTEHAVAWVVGRLRGSSAPLPPGAVAPAVLFMGTGFRACSSELRGEVWALLCDLLRPPLPATTACTANAAALPAGVLPVVPPPAVLLESVTHGEDVATGVRLVVGELLQEDPGRAHWLMSCWLAAVADIAVAAARTAVCSPATAATSGSSLPMRPMQEEPPCGPPSCERSAAWGPHELHALWAVQHALRTAQLGSALKQLGMTVVQQLAAAPPAPGPGAPPAPPSVSDLILDGLLRVVGMIQDGCVPVGAAPEPGSNSTERDHMPCHTPHPHSLTPEEEALSATCLLAAAGLLEGLDAGVRQLAAAVQPRVAGLLGRAVTVLVAGVQAGLSLACVVDASGSDQAAATGGATAGAISWGMMLRWAAGVAYGRLRGAAGGAALCTQLQPPAPAAARLPGLLAAALSSVCAGGPVTGLAACALLHGMAPAAAREWLAEEVGGSPLYVDAPVVAKALVEELRVVLGQVPLAWQPTSTAPSISTSSSAQLPLPASSHDHGNAAQQKSSGHVSGPHEQSFEDAFGQGRSAAAGASGSAQQGPPPAVLHAQAVGAGVLRELRAGAARAARAWSALTLQAPPGWIELLVMQLPPSSTAPASGSTGGTGPTSGQQLREALDRLWVLTLTPLSVVLHLWPRDPHTLTPPSHSMTAIPDQAPQAPTTAMQAAGLPGRQAVGLAALLAVADLQFCAVQLPITSELVTAAVGEVVRSPAACSAFLEALPCYDAIVQPIQAAVSASTGVCSPVPQLGAPLQPLQQGLGGPTSAPPSEAQQQAQAHASQPFAASAAVPGAPQAPQIQARWASDAVLGAKVAFLLPIAAVCATRAHDACAAAHQLLPLLFLLMRHPQPPLVAASHTAFTTLMSHLSSPSLTMFDQVKPGQTAGSSPVQLLEQALPYYVQRNLALPLQLPCLEGLEKGLPVVLRGVPTASPTAMYCLQQLTDAATTWLLAHPQEALDFSPLYVASGPQGLHGLAPGMGPEPPPVLPHVKLVSLACSTVLLCDWQLLPRMADAVAGVVAAAAAAPEGEFAPEGNVSEDLGDLWGQGSSNSVSQRPYMSSSPGTSTAAATGMARRAAVLQHLHDMLLRSDDYARKPQLFEWLQLLAAGAGARTGTAGTSVGVQNLGVPVPVMFV